MPRMITEECINCGECLPVCPTSAISRGPEIFVINQQACNDCSGYSSEPACEAVCPVDCIPPAPANFVAASWSTSRGASSIVRSGLAPVSPIAFATGVNLTETSSNSDFGIKRNSIENRSSDARAVIGSFASSPSFGFDRATFVAAADAALAQHVDLYVAAPDIESSLPLMDAGNFARFREHALNIATERCATAMRAAYANAVPKELASYQYMTALSVQSVATGSIRDALRPCYAEYDATVSNLTSLLSTFRLKMQRAGERVEENAGALGTAAGFLGAMLLGPLGGIAAGAAAGWMAGNQVDEELKRDFQQLHDAMEAVLDAWPTDRLAMEIEGRLGQYAAALDVAAAQARREQEEERRQAAEQERTRREAEQRRAAPRVPVSTSREQAHADRTSERPVRSLPVAIVSAVLLVLGVAGYMSYRKWAVPVDDSDIVTPIATPTASGDPTMASEPSRLAIVKAGAKVLAGPAATFGTVVRADADLPVLVLDASVPGWLKVRVGTDAVGWVSSQQTIQ